MVVFTCQECNSTLKKNAVEKHFSCRPLFLTCIDCLKDFRGKEYEAHTSCITEAEKYGGGNTFVKPQGVKQEKWAENVKRILTEISNNLRYQKLCQSLKEASNIPRNRNKFHNFVRNASPRLYNSEIVEEIFDHLEKAKGVRNESNKSTEESSSCKNDNETKLDDKAVKKKEKQIRRELMNKSNLSLNEWFEIKHGESIEKSQEDIGNGSKTAQVYNTCPEDKPAGSLKNANGKIYRKKKKSREEENESKSQAASGSENDPNVENSNQKKKKKKKKREHLEDFTEGEYIVNTNDSFSRNDNGTKIDKKSVHESAKDVNVETKQMDISEGTIGGTISCLKDCSNIKSGQQTDLQNKANEPADEVCMAEVDINNEKLSKKELKKLRKKRKYLAEVAAIESKPFEEEPTSFELGNKVEKKKKKLKKNGVTKMETDEIENKEAENDCESSGSPKRKHENDEEIVEKKMKLNDTLKEDIHTKIGKKFKWSNVIKQILETSTDKEMPLKKLRKKVLNEYSLQKGDDTPYEKLLGLFNKKVNCTEGVKVIRDKAQLLISCQQS